MKRIVSSKLVLALISCLVTYSVAGVHAADPAAPQSASPETALQKEARLKWWREGRFGMFIHWGPISLKGTEISWSRANTNPGCPNQGEIPAAVYDNLYKQFNPTAFDADRWVAIAKDAGMKYMVLTAKHCDGFLLWPSKTSDYNMAATPFKRSICSELADAARKQGIRIGWYFSPMDWRDSDFRTGRNALFINRIQGELKELLGNHGHIDLLWFDWDGCEPLYDQSRTYQIVKQLQPGIVINNRLDLGRGDSDRQIKSPSADYYTPEQQLGSYDDQRPWETCLTLGTQWAWKPNDTVKSTAEVIRTLAFCAGGDGNLLLNVGPMPDGRIEPRQVDVLEGVGKWLRRNGESIYGTRGGPYKSNTALASTRKGNVIYLHALKPAGQIALPAIPRKVLGAAFLAGGKISVNQTADGILLHVPAKSASDSDAVVKLDLDGSAMDIPAIVVASPAMALPNGIKVAASNTFQSNPDLGPDKAFDGRPDTRWATDAGERQAWLTIEYPKPTKVSSIAMSEEYDRVKSFELQFRDSSNWTTIFKGTTIGHGYHKPFPPVTAKLFRLNITDALDGPTFWEITLK
jgi:alpha-L-fucosidase